MQTKTVEMNQQTKTAFEFLMGTQQGRDVIRHSWLDADTSESGRKARRGDYQESSVGSDDYQQGLAEANEKVFIIASIRLANKVGQLIGRNQFPAAISAQSQSDKIDYAAIVREWDATWRRERDAYDSDRGLQ